jgi:Tol biopolymer transport system component
MRQFYSWFPILLALATAGSARRAAAEERRMAFVAQQNAINYIYLMDIDASGLGANPVRLTSDAEEENYPSWSPDGERLAYQRGYNGSAIYVINADGSGEQRLSPTPGFDVTPSWSPDGSQIVFARLYEAPAPNMPPMTDIRIMNVDGTGDRSILTNTLFSVEPRWSVNNQVVFMSLMNSSDLEIYVMNIDSSGLRQLTDTGNNGDPVWSPEGTRITFGSDREGGNKVNIFAMNADGSQLEQLTHFNVPDEAGDTNWSSDGLKIAFEWDIDGMEQSDPNAYAEVWTMNPDGSGEMSTGVQCSGVGCAPRWGLGIGVQVRWIKSAVFVFHRVGARQQNAICFGGLDFPLILRPS